MTRNRARKDLGINSLNMMLFALMVEGSTLLSKGTGSLSPSERSDYIMQKSPVSAE